MSNEKISRSLSALGIILAIIALALVGCKNSVISTSEPALSTLPDSVSGCGHAVAEYVDGKKISWRGGRSIGMCDFEDLTNHQAGTVNLAGFDINYDAGIFIQKPNHPESQGLAWIEATKVDTPVKYDVTGWRMSMRNDINVWGDVTITRDKNSPFMKINDIMYPILSFVVKGNSYSIIGNDKTSYNIVLMQTPAGGFVPAARTHDQSNIYARSIITPTDINITSISFDTGKTE